MSEKAIPLQPETGDTDTAQLSADPRIRPVPTGEVDIPRLLGALSAGLFICGLVLNLIFLLDLVPFLPPQFASVIWQTTFLERIFGTGSILTVGFLALLSSIWASDVASGRKSKLRTRITGVIALLVGISFLASIQLYTRNLNTVFQAKKVELENQRASAAPAESSTLANRFSQVSTELDQAFYKSLARSNTTAGLIGIALALLGVVAIRYTRQVADVGFTCPTCGCQDVRVPRGLSATESSLALLTRVHTFRCKGCGWRFRRFSLTGKPFTFFF